MRRFPEQNNETTKPGMDKTIPKTFQTYPHYGRLNQPWMKKKHKKDESKTLKYHYELLRFSEWASPTKEERAMRGDVVSRLKKIIHSVHPDSKVEVYGSFESDLCVPQSDIDLVVFNTNLDLPSRGPALMKLAFEIHKHDISETFPSVITSPKVPIIKLTDAKTKCMVDINFENETGVKNTKLIKHFLSEYPFLRPLTIVLKYFLKLCRLNDTWTGGIGSYTLLIMIISFLQKHTLSKGKSNAPSEEENLCTILTGFMKFYGSVFDYRNTVISVLNGGRYIPKEEKSWVNEDFPDALAVEDPQNPDNDLGKASFNIENARLSFQFGYDLLTDENIRRPQDSIVSRILYVPPSEIEHRNQIKNLYGNHRQVEKVVKKKRKCSFIGVGLDNDTCNICSDDSGNDEENNHILSKPQPEEESTPDLKPVEKNVSFNNAQVKESGHNNQKKKRNTQGSRRGKKPVRDGQDKRKQKSAAPQFQLDDTHFPTLESIYQNPKSKEKGKEK